MAEGQQLILASGSPRRKELLGDVGLSFEILVPGSDEEVLPGESAMKMVERLALRKAWAIAEKNRTSWVLGADTTVVLHGEILGKPLDAQDAERMLSGLQGTTHQVVGAFAVINAARAVEHVEVHRSSVTMVPLSKERIRDYVSSGEPMDKAGSYAIQGIGASLVAAVDGSYTNVVGLNLSAVLQALLKLGALAM
jgi:septum formation protein